MQNNYHCKKLNYMYNVCTFDKHYTQKKYMSGDSTSLFMLIHHCHCEYNDLYNWGINYVNHSKVLQCVLRQKFSYSTNMKQTQ